MITIWDNNNTIISNIDDWRYKCPPWDAQSQWKDGYSAKETAKHWVNGPPIEFSQLLKPLGISIDLDVYPEHRTRFDKYGGNTRNHDLFILDKINKIAIGIESKVDEKFDDTISEKIREAEKELEGKPGSNALNRIRNLRQAVFGRIHSNQSELRYQLLHSIAGTVAEAGIQNYEKAVFLVQTFLSPIMASKKHRTNQSDLDRFVEYLTKGRIKTIYNGDLLYVGRLPGNVHIPNDVELYIGKFDIKIY